MKHVAKIWSFVLFSMGISHTKPYHTIRLANESITITNMSLSSAKKNNPRKKRPLLAVKLLDFGIDYRSDFEQLFSTQRTK